MKPLMRMGGANVEHVHELYILGTRTWNEQLVRDSFLPRHAEEIKLDPAYGCKRTYTPGLLKEVGGIQSDIATEF